jgi:ribosomal protein S8
MSCNFLLADFVAHVKNCVLAKLQYASFRYSKLIESVCIILKEDGYISDYDVFGDGIKKLVRIKFIEGDIWVGDFDSFYSYLFNTLLKFYFYIKKAI